MSKYEDLWKALEADGRENLYLSFQEIEAILRVQIDHSFLTYKKEAKNYGYEVGKISMKERRINFKKIYANSFSNKDQGNLLKEK